MADSNKKNTSAADTRPIPSQAEGNDPTESGEGLRPRPSQAEGDEETVEQALREKEGKRQ